MTIISRIPIKNICRIISLSIPDLIGMLPLLLLLLLSSSSSEYELSRDHNLTIIIYKHRTTHSALFRPTTTEIVYILVDTKEEQNMDSNFPSDGQFNYGNFPFIPWWYLKQTGTTPPHTHNWPPAITIIAITNTAFGTCLTKYSLENQTTHHRGTTNNPVLS